MIKLLTTLFCLFTTGAVYANIFLPSLMQFSPWQSAATFPENFPYFYYRLYVFILILCITIADTLILQYLSKDSWKRILGLTIITNFFLAAIPWYGWNGSLAWILGILLPLTFILWPLTKLNVSLAWSPIKINPEYFLCIMSIIYNSCIKFFIFWLFMGLADKKKHLFLYLILANFTVIIIDYNVLKYLDRYYKMEYRA